jgi:GNAT superfamily N-acetyltransferase
MHSKSYSLRPTTWDDFEFVFRLNKVNLQKSVDRLHEWNEEAERAELRRKFVPGRDQIIQIKGQDAGVFTIEYHNSEVYLHHVELLPEFQGKGIGTALIRDVLTEAKLANVPVTFQDLQEKPTKQFYSQLGLRDIEEVEEKVDDNGINCDIKRRMSTIS